MKLPSENVKQEILKEMVSDLKSCAHIDEDTNALHPTHCAVCNCVPNHCDKMKSMNVEKFGKLCEECDLDQHWLEKYCEKETLDQCSTNHEDFK